MVSNPNSHTHFPAFARECSMRILFAAQKRKEGRKKSKTTRSLAHLAPAYVPRPATPPPPPPPCPGGPHCPCFVIFPACPIIPFPGEKQSVLDLKEKGPCLYHVQLGSHQNASVLVCKGRVRKRKRESAAAGGWGLSLSSAACPQWR